MGAFNRTDCVHIFNIVRTLGKEHLGMLRLFHFHYVNPSALRIDTATMDIIALLPEDAPWARVAVSCWAYMVDAQHYMRCGQYMLAKGVSKSSVVAAGRQLDWLLDIDRFLGHCLKGCQPEEPSAGALKACGALLSRAGRTILKGGRASRWTENNLQKSS